MSRTLSFRFGSGAELGGLAGCVAAHKVCEGAVGTSVVSRVFSLRAAGPGLQVYEQIHPHTRFGEQMVKNLALRGADLKGIEATSTLEAHQARFTQNAWERAFAADLKDIYQHHIDPHDRVRIERIEMFDEFEEWHMIMSHYCIAVGVNDAVGALAGFAFEAYSTRTAAALATRGLAPGIPAAMQLPIAD